MTNCGVIGGSETTRPFIPITDQDSSPPFSRKKPLPREGLT